MRSYNGFTGEQRIAGDKIVKKAISDGILPNPNTQPCCVCGQDKGIRHYHQEDYTPEHIVENSRCVCWRCHMMIHTRFRHPKSFEKYMIDTVINKKQFAPVYKPNDWGKLNENYID